MKRGLLLLVACYRGTPPPPPLAGVAPPSPPPAAACVLVGTVHDDVKIAPDGDRIISDVGRLAVLDVDVIRGTARPRLELPLDEPLHVRGAAIRGNEVVLQLFETGDDFRIVPARIDLAARRLERGEPDLSGDPRAAGAIASDGHVYFRSCVDRHSHSVEMCRGQDWEVRGARLDPALDTRDFFDAIAVAGGELYAIGDTTVHVFDLASGQRTRHFAISHAADDGAGIAGDELVVLDRTTLARFDRVTGDARGTTRAENAFGLRLTCR